MTSETLLTQQSREEKQHKFYVYFDEWTGAIKSITNKPRNSKFDCLETYDEFARDLMLGVHNIKRYVVADLVDGYKIVPKENYVRLKRAENYLSKLQQIESHQNRDVNVILYLNAYKLEVNISMDMVYTITGRLHNEKIRVDRNTEYDSLVFYVVERNNPLHLLEVIEIDPVDLIAEGYKLYDLSHLRNIIELGNVDILTKRIFKSYGLKIKQNYVTVDHGFNKSSKKSHLEIYDKYYEDYTTFSVSPSTQGWIVRSNFENPHEHKIYKDVKIFLTGNNPNILLDKIVIPYDKLGNHQEFILETKVDPTTCKILVGEEGRYMSFKHEEIEYVESGKY